MGKPRTLALIIANALLLSTVALPFVPSAVAHDCTGEYEVCGDCPDGENHHHVDSGWWWWEDEYECTSEEGDDPPPPPPPRRCANGEDDDGDGKIDDADPGCRGQYDDSEQDPEEPTFCEEYEIPRIVCDLRDFLLGDGSLPLVETEVPN